MSGKIRLYLRGNVYWAWYYSANGKRLHRSTRTPDRRAAEAIARSFELEAADPDSAVRARATLSDAVALLMSDRREQAKAGRRSEDTVDFYERKAGQLLRVLEHDESGSYTPLRLAALRPADVDRYISTRRAEGIAENTIHKELIALRASLKLARRAGIWKGDVAEVCPIAFAPEYKPRERFASPRELELLLKELTPDRAARVAFIVATSACWRETERARDEDALLSFSLNQVHLPGTKRSTRNRIVPLVFRRQVDLLEYALRHAAGAEGQLFAPWTNVRRDLRAACERVQEKLRGEQEERGEAPDAVCAPLSPNDLRRTYSTWMRAEGIPLEYIAPTMGHADTRMLERVYARLPSAELQRLMARYAGLDCNAGGAEREDSGASGGLAGQLAAAKSLKSLPRDGIEPSTRGFSVPCSTD